MDSQTCKVCSTNDNTVKWTRKPDGVVWRRRQCNSCGHRWTTLEVLAEQFVDLQTKANEFKRLMLAAGAARP